MRMNRLVPGCRPIWRYNLVTDQRNHGYQYNNTSIHGLCNKLGGYNQTVDDHLNHSKNSPESFSGIQRVCLEA